MRAVYESPVAEKRRPCLATVEGEAVVEMREGRLGGLSRLLPCFLLFLDLFDNRREHGWVRDSAFARKVLSISFGALGFAC